VSDKDRTEPRSGSFPMATGFDFDTLVDRSGTGSQKWDRYADRDVIPMWVADMDFRSPPAVISALQDRVAHGVFGYTSAPAELTEVIVAHLARDCDWRIEPQWIVWLPGLVTGLNLACLLAGERGDAVVTLTPVYPPFLSAPRHAQRECIRVPLMDPGTGWVIDFDRLETAITSRTRMLLLCNPHNPVGRVYTADELQRVAKLCLRHDLTVCSDEIHYGLVLDADRRHLPLAAVAPEIAERSLTLLAPSKTYNIPGLGMSFAVVPGVPLRQRLLQAMAGFTPAVNALGFTAALAAYRDGAAWHAALLDYLRGNRDLVEARMAAMPRVAMRHVEATYLAWIDARRIGVEDPQRFFEQAGLAFSDGKDFGAPGFVRLNFGCRRALLEQALDRMATALLGG
jgi:cystathionine beta-lyase